MNAPSPRDCECEVLVSAAGFPHGRGETRLSIGRQSPLFITLAVEDLRSGPTLPISTSPSTIHMGMRRSSPERRRGTRDEVPGGVEDWPGPACGRGSASPRRSLFAQAHAETS